MGMDKYLDIEQISAYSIAYQLSNYMWDVVVHWDWFAKKTIGSQFVAAMDSVSANIAEGYGRYFKKDKVKFYRYSRGSAVEAIDWTNKAYSRKLLSSEQFKKISDDLQILPKEINSLINYTNLKLKV